MYDKKLPARRGGRSRRASPTPEVFAEPIVAPLPDLPPEPPIEAPPVGELSLEELPLSGNLDAVCPDGTVIAWCWSPAEPEVRRAVSLWIDGGEVARAICDQPRPDLIEAGVGDGAHALEFHLPPEIARPGEAVLVELYDVATSRRIGTEVAVTWDGAPPQAPAAEPVPRTLVGHLDRVSREGWVSGWCWYPSHPGEHVGLTVLVDGRPVGTVEAADAREDLLRAGIGDGNHAFAFALPSAVLDDAGMITVEVRETATGTALAAPMLMRTSRPTAAEERIQDLERQVRLLRAEFEGLERHQRAHEQDGAARALFATMADFFRSLAQGDDGLLARSDLRAAVEDVTGRFAPLALTVAEAPAATICVSATAPVAMLYRCLAALHHTGADARADIVLLDDGGLGGAAALLPAVVHNLRYLRVPAHATPITARNAVATDGRGPLVAWVAPQVVVHQDWFDEIVGAFADDPGLAVVTSKVVRDDGLLHHTGLLLGADGVLRDPGRLTPVEAPEHNASRELDGCGDVAFAVRRDRMEAVGGFGSGFANPAYAVFDLCMRLRAEGGRVLYQPLAVATWLAEGALDRSPVPDLSLPDEDARRLRLDWVSSRAGA